MTSRVCTRTVVDAQKLENTCRPALPSRRVTGLSNDRSSENLEEVTLDPRLRSVGVPTDTAVEGLSVSGVMPGCATNEATL